MKKKPKVIVLGGTNPHIFLIKKLQKLGYFIVLVDCRENPPAKKYADKFIKESTLEKEKVLEIAKKIKPSLVITSCIDQANVTACYVGEKMGLNIPYSYETSLKVTNKGLMKKIMLEGGVSTSKYILIKEGQKINLPKLKFPLMVKPSDSCGSKSVRKARNINELKKYLKIAILKSRSKEAIIEEFKEGIEVSADCFIKNNKVCLITTNHRISLESGGNSVMRCFSIITPADISKKARENIKKEASKIAKVFALNNTPLFIQTIVREDNVNVIEFAPRVGGSLNFRTVELNSGFDILRSAINSFLGRGTEIDLSYSDYYYATNNLYSRPSLFGNISGYKKLIKNGTIEEFFQDKSKGEKCGIEMASKDRVATFLVKGKNKKELEEKTKIAMNSLKVYSKEGKEVLKRDVFLGK